MRTFVLIRPSNGNVLAVDEWLTSSPADKLTCEPPFFGTSTEFTGFPRITEAISCPFSWKEAY